MSGVSACVDCGQTILFKPGERTVCGRCELNGPPRSQADVDAAKPVVMPQPSIPCRGCGRSTVEGEDTRLPLADGWCLGCRLDGAHTR